MDQTANGEAMSSRWIDDIVKVMEKLGGIASLEQINAEIPSVRKSLSKTWRATVRRTIQEHSSDTTTFRTRGGDREDLFFSIDGLGSGIWGLRSHVEATPDAIDSDSEPLISHGEVEPKRVAQKTYRVLRDTELARQMKLLYKDRCQICNTALEIAPGVTYSEAHHIIPLGKHNGPDVPGNILVLCPNHHALCDYGGIPLGLSDLTVRPGHDICPESLRHHNEHVYGLLGGLNESFSQNELNERPMRLRKR